MINGVSVAQELHNNVHHYFKSQNNLDPYFLGSPARYILDENGPLNFRADILKRNQSSLPDLYEYVNGVNIAQCNSLKKWEYNWGHTPYKFTLPRNKQVDICSLEDYELAKYLFSNK